MITIKTSLPYFGCFESRQGGRNENQDSCGYDETPLGLLLVVCDGMGGGPSGKLASTIAARSIIDALKQESVEVPPSVAMTRAIKEGNQALRYAIEQDPALNGMGTTVVALLLGKREAVIGHVGDSRCYQLRGSNRVFRTSDHSKVAEMVRNKVLTEEQARLSAYSNIITRALGTQNEVEPEIDIRPYVRGDRFVLCTDGVWGSMPENELIRQFSRTPSLEGTIESVAITVDELGFASGGRHDNHTQFVVETKVSSESKDKFTISPKILASTAVAILLILIAAFAIFFSNGSNEQKEENAKVVEKTAETTPSSKNKEQKQQEAPVSNVQENTPKAQTEQVESPISDELKKKQREDEAKAEADKKAKAEENVKESAQANKEQKKNNVLNNNSISKEKQDLINSIDRFISTINEIKNMSQGSPKNKKLKELREDMNRKNQQRQFDWCIARLSDKIASRDRNADGVKKHFEDIIKRLEEIKKNIKNSK